MLRSAKYSMLIGFTLLLGSCGDTKHTGEIEAEDVIDTLVLDKTAIMELTRVRQIKNSSSSLRIGKLNLNVNMRNLATKINVTYTIDSGYMVYSKKAFQAKCFINTRQVVTPVIDENRQLVADVPAYLAESPNGMIEIEYTGNFYPHEQNATASCYMTVGDTSGLVTGAINTIRTNKKHDRVQAIHTQFYMDGIKWKLFDEKNRQEIVKDSISGSIVLQFK